MRRLSRADRPLQQRQAPRALAHQLWAGVLLWSAAIAAQAAANLSVYPLKLAIAPGKLADTVTLGNEGAAAVTVQATLLRWRQVDDGQGGSRDEETPTTELLVTPPVFTLLPGQSRAIRVGRITRQPSLAVEDAYRLELAEVVDESRRASGGAQTTLTISLPVFLLSENRKAEPLLAAPVVTADGADLLFSFANDGPVHARIGQMRVIVDGRSCAQKTFGTYLLPGRRQRLRWADAADLCTAGAAMLSVDFDGAPRHRDWPIELPTAAKAR